MDIADNRVVTIHFTLTDADGAVITTTRGHDPLVYMHGKGSIVPGMEAALTGKQAGEQVQAQVAPDMGMGPHHAELVQTLPRSAYPGEDLAIGKKLTGSTARGPLPVVVTAFDDETITVDGNHPLAGKHFTAEMEVLDVRVPTPHEIQFGLG